jgi:hypothetical protein
VLKKFLGPHQGRENPKLKALAEESGYSIHMIQSVARGRRKFRDEFSVHLAIGRLKKEKARAR